ncbi:MAG: DUF1989 domain-containing protein [Streptosporangiaceae bacterium]
MTDSRQSHLLVAAGTGGAVRIGANTRFAVVDVEGGQVGDLFAFNAGATTEFASASHSRSVLGKLFPRPGDVIYTSLRRPMLALEEDNSPGRHDTLYAACDPRRYEMLGVVGPHRSCAVNLAEAMDSHGGLTVPTPQPFNVFMEVSIDAEGNSAISPATSQAGDHLVFRALMEVIVVLSSCPQDVNPISTGGITPLAIDVR